MTPSLYGLLSDLANLVLYSAAAGFGATAGVAVLQLTSRSSGSS